jgi:hypothetical protein
MKTVQTAPGCSAGKRQIANINDSTERQHDSSTTSGGISEISLDVYLATLWMPRRW